jgi:hypothetical protein
MVSVLYERMKAESEELLAQLERSAFDAEWSAARSVVFERVRVDTHPLRSMLAELEALDGSELIPRTLEPAPPVNASVTIAD